MACLEIHSWTFSGLVGAFLDITIAYLLVCGSAAVFFAQKFLGIFGLSLPCPCDGTFGRGNRNHCFQRMLVDCPLDKVSNVRLSVKRKFPFDALLLSDDKRCQSKLVEKEDNADGFVELEGEGSCSLLSEAENLRVSDGEGSISKCESGSCSGATNLPIVNEGFDAKGKGRANRKTRSRLRHRRKSTADSGKTSFLAACDAFCSDEGETSTGSGKRNLFSSEYITASDDDVIMQKHLYGEDSRCPVCGRRGYNGDDKDAIRLLEQALEKEQTARAALYLELDQERSAAATAANETMAMISRLQEERAVVELEARQYQRMVEEKFAYDAEEMNILKEILLRREREKHFLEKEVEAYRHMIFTGDEQLASRGHPTEHKGGDLLAPSINSTEDPLAMLHRLNESIGSREEVSNEFGCEEYEVTSLERRNNVASAEKQPPIEAIKQEKNQRKPNVGKPSSVLRLSNEDNQEFHEKSVVYIDGTLHAQGVGALCTEDGAEDFKEHMKDLDQGRNDVQNALDNVDLSVHDVHVIGDEESAARGEIADATSKFFGKFEVSCEVPCDASEMQKLETSRSNSAVCGGGLPPLAYSHGKNLLSDTQRRHSISELEINNEKTKIVSEVGWLQERLRVVQEEKEKLNFSMGHRETEKIHLRLLEDIAGQLREIRQLREPEKSSHQVSLPPPSSKVLSKRRRCRSASLGVRQSY